MAKARSQDGLLVAIPNEIADREHLSLSEVIPLDIVHFSPVDDKTAVITSAITGAATTVGYTERYGNRFDLAFNKSPIPEESNN